MTTPDTDIQIERSVTGAIIITIPIDDHRERYVELIQPDWAIHTSRIRDRSRDLVVRRWSRKRDSDGRSKEAIMRDVIVDRFKQGHATFTIGSITEHVPFGEVTVRRAINELERKDIIERVPPTSPDAIRGHGRGRMPITYRYVDPSTLPAYDPTKHIASAQGTRSEPVAGTGKGTAKPTGEVRSLLREAIRRGAVVTPTANGHYAVRYGGRTITTIPSTPSDHRWKRNARAQMRRGGLNV